jgi:hypothetical protein
MTLYRLHIYNFCKAHASFWFVSTFVIITGGHHCYIEVLDSRHKYMGSKADKLFLLVGNSMTSKAANLGVKAAKSQSWLSFG